ncbi:hypothetical protein FSC37_13695 [Piscinibacter aquaticus]|uniref:Histidine kinase/HSP90-like ATPase domain-containing protein n=1 Tax=Piscinibacter aquaticus TaxID=392597 RepID=A0A5C6U4C5_9BURK|nr:hypothetical protein FSC37_13695 [Piscinibacter aquaticus]
MARHAQASAAQVTLRWPDGSEAIEWSVSDDGVGLPDGDAALRRGKRRPASRSACGPSAAMCCCKRHGPAGAARLEAFGHAVGQRAMTALPSAVPLGAAPGLGETAPTGRAAAPGSAP